MTLLLSCAQNTSLVEPTAESSFDLKVKFAPQELKSTNGMINIMYSLEASNFETDGYKLRDFQVVNSSNNKILCSISDTNKYLVILKPDNVIMREDLYYYPQNAHLNYIFLVDLISDPSQVPQRIKHKLILTKNSKQWIVEGEEVSVSKAAVPLFSPPLKGELFMSANSTTLENNHHPKICVTYKGNTTIPERYCIDWNKIDASGNTYNGDPGVCENWYIYGQNVYAVSIGEVVSVNDGMPDQFPVGTKSADLTMFNGIGNSVTLAVPGGYVTYGHMIKNSIAVKIGQSVSRGQLIGKVGNSGNSDAPHLHIGLHTDFPYYISEGLPYCYDSIEKIGSVENNSIKWLPSPQIHTNEFVENYGIYNLK
jgi:hypothetical protein